MPRRTYLALALVALLVALPRIVTDVVDTSFYIIDEDTPGDEDAYVLADFGSVESVLDGDLMIAVYEDLTISGTVTGDVVVAAGGAVTITDSGVVEGSLRGVARSVVIDGEVGDDVAMGAITIEIDGEVGRDVIGSGGRLEVGGSVGRNVQGWFWTARIDAAVGNDVDVRVRALDVGAATRVSGDVLYRADTAATVAGSAEVSGSLAQLSTRAPFVVRVALALFTIFGLIAFTLLGLFVLWSSQRAAPRAAGAVVTRPVRVGLVGLGAVLGMPVAVSLLAVAVQPFLAKVAVVVLALVLAVIAVLLGPVPALAAAGNAVTRGRAGLLGGFVIGVVVWRAVVWVLPLLGFLISLALLVFGVGGWLTSWWDRRAARRVVRTSATGPSAGGSADDDEGGGAWEPPLPPLPAAATTPDAGASDEDRELDS